MCRKRSLPTPAAPPSRGCFGSGQPSQVTLEDGDFQPPAPWALSHPPPPACVYNPPGGVGLIFLKKKTGFFFSSSTHTGTDQRKYVITVTLILQSALCVHGGGHVRPKTIYQNQNLKSTTEERKNRMWTQLPSAS